MKNHPFNLLLYFFFNDTATTEIYTLSLHDALPIYAGRKAARRAATGRGASPAPDAGARRCGVVAACGGSEIEPSSSGERSEEHTSELQSQSNLVCRLLLEKKKQRKHLHLSQSNERR